MNTKMDQLLAEVAKLKEKLKEVEDRLINRCKECPFREIATRVLESGAGRFPPYEKSGING